ncbi:MAG: hydrolase 1, exosortase A system-associated [Betaproteobacteria bacterium]|nr:hydrolase 1, exosortase A system-associated [Betaproteobacteria bacterium]
MTYGEEALVFPVADDELVGILTRPALPRNVGVVIVVGGPQYRVGSHRQFVLLARDLAEAGYATFRFDYRGMGDSSGEMRSFEDVHDDIRAAIDALGRAVPDVERVVIWGLCDAASAALMYAPGDTRVAGLALLNPWVRSDQSHAAAQVRHYYRERLMNRDMWAKILSGRFDFRASARSLFDTVRRAVAKGPSGDERRSFQERMLEGWQSFPGPVLLVLSGNDLTAREFEDHCGASAGWAGMLQRHDLTRHSLEEADHTFSTRRWRNEVARITTEWLGNSLGGPPSASPH